jgi:hypothetical protein
MKTDHCVKLSHLDKHSPFSGRALGAKKEEEEEEERESVCVCLYKYIHIYLKCMQL